MSAGTGQAIRRPGLVIREHRRAAGLTQQQLAEASGVSVATLRDIEQERTARPRLASTGRLARALGLDWPLAGPYAQQASASDTGRTRLRVLGPLTAWRGGRPVALGGARQRAVLGLLALHPDLALHRSALIDALWSDSPPASAAKMIQSHIGRLRHLLDPGQRPQDPDGLLVSTGTSYRLQASAAELDLITFRQFVARGREARQAGQHARACGCYEDALNLWRAEPLADVEPLFAHPAVRGLAHQWVAAVHEHAASAAAAGLHARALPYLRALTVRDRLNERAHAQLMLALASSGQQAVALAIFHELRHRLDDQLGVRPGAELAGAYARVLR
jgi:DNA-binding SARP family transcriptional activator/DNA-binding XRE family transcriptional regulator